MSRPALPVHASTKSAGQTKDLGAALGELTRPGDVVLLVGELGTGKTTFVQGFARGLGIEEAITSPTFTLARSHEGGRLLLHHLDVYRLDTMDEIFDVGLPELLDDGGVTIIEWGDAIAPALPADYLEVRLGYGDDDEERSVVLAAVGPSWTARSRALAQAVANWTAADPC